VVRAWKNDSLVLDAGIVAAVIVGGGIIIVRNPLGYGHILSVLLIGQKTSYYYAEAQVVAAILGFLIAATAIIGTGAMTGLQMLKEQRFAMYKRLVQTFAESMFACLVAITFAMVAVVADQDSKARPWGVLLAVGVLMLVVLRVTRAARRLYMSLLL